jgi:hypothetical protein
MQQAHKVLDGHVVARAMPLPESASSSRGPIKKSSSFANDLSTRFQPFVY